jgi:hypothetical protein
LAFRTAGEVGGFESKRRMGEGENGGPARCVEEEDGGSGSWQDARPVKAGGVGWARAGRGLSGWGKIGEENPLTGGPVTVLAV